MAYAEAADGRDQCFTVREVAAFLAVSITTVYSLMHSEIALAKAEIGADAKKAALGAGLFAAAGTLVFLALVLLPIAAVFASWFGTLLAGRATLPAVAFAILFASGTAFFLLVMVALADKADFDVVVFFAMAQIPMYMLPALLRPVYRRLLARA